MRRSIDLPNTAREYPFIFLRGVAMGAADIVPGVSGGTIAFLTGILARLIDAIRSIDLAALRLLFSGKIRELWRRIDGTFLVSLLAGILFSIFSLARLMEYLLEHRPIETWSFFFGLVFASTIVVLLRITKWSPFEPILFAVGTVFAWYLTGLGALETPDSLPFIFLSGMVAITAMILPGISGSFILVILGKYATVLGALNDRNITILVVFALGCAIGIGAFSRLLGLVMKRFWNATVATLAGFMLGSLNKIWPWKITISTYIDRHGVEQPLLQENIFPSAFSETSGAIAAAAVGFLLVVTIEWLSSRRANRSGSSVITDRVEQPEVE